jgi:hypothetical protein
MESISVDKIALHSLFAFTETRHAKEGASMEESGREFDPVRSIPDNLRGDSS